jgi:hypothetical protein
MMDGPRGLLDYSSKKQKKKNKKKNKKNTNEMTKKKKKKNNKTKQKKTQHTTKPRDESIKTGPSQANKTRLIKNQIKTK